MSTKAFEEAHETVCDKAVLDLLAAIDFENLTDIQRKQLKIVKILLKAADDIRQVLNPMEIGGIATGASQGEYIMPPTKNFHTKNRELLKKVETSTEPAIVGKTVVGAVMPSCLRLSLKTKWFEMTKAKIKPEDYREINDYWCRRLLELDEETEWDIWQELIEDLANPKRKHEDVYQCLSFFGARFKKFDCNIMALGYPKSSDNERILKLEHKGIEIRTGNPEWGAEPNKLYFVIMHGAILA